MGAMFGGTVDAIDAQLDALVAAEKLRAAQDAAQVRVIAQLAAADISAKQYVREQIACVLGISTGTAQRRIAVAQTLVADLPETLRALECGVISYWHALVLAEALADLDPQVRRAVEGYVLRRAEGRSVAELRRTLTRALAKFDPRSHEAKAVRAAADRKVDLFPAPDGMASLYALLPAVDAAAVLAAVQAGADQLTHRGDGRSADQRRADTLIDLCTRPDSNRPGRGRGSGGRGAAVAVTVALSTLLGLDCQPGELAGYGPLPAPVAAALAFDPTSTWRRLLTDDAGTVLQVSRRYRPPAPLAEFVVARDRTCRFPTCTRTATTCQLDHIIAWSTGGLTSAANLQALCPRHHHVKHEAGWQVHRHPDGTTEWTDPTGRTYRKPPDDLPHDTTLDPPPEPEPPPTQPLTEPPPSDGAPAPRNGPDPNLDPPRASPPDDPPPF